MEVCEFKPAYPSSSTSQPDALTQWQQSPALDIGGSCKLDGCGTFYGMAKKGENDLGIEKL